MAAAKASAGDSATPLAKKLGLVPGARAYVVGAPASLEALFAGLTLLEKLRAPVMYAHLFSIDRSQVGVLAPKIAAVLDDRGMFWISWPKKASKVATTVDEAVVRCVGLATGLVDVKICAVDEIWSGLKFVRRVRDR